MEIFKDIPGYAYQISNLGRVKSLIGKGRILKERDNNGYCLTTLCNKGEKLHINTHRLVAKIFLPQVKGKNEINHIDGDKKNNNIENLEWCTHSENHQHKIRQLGHKTPFQINNPNKGKLGGKNHNSKRVGQFNTKGKLIKIWGGVREAERNLKLANISKVCRGMQKICGGFIFKYI